MKITQRLRPHFRSLIDSLMGVGAAALILSGCSLKSGNEHRIQVSFPSGANRMPHALFENLQTQNLLYQGLSNPSSFPIPQSLDDFNCFGMNVSGSGIDNSTEINECLEPEMPSPGILGGFANIQGGTIEVLVPAGTDRVFQLLVVQSEIGCPAVALANANHFAGIGRPYEVSRTVANVSGDTSINMHASFNSNNPKRWFCGNKMPSLVTSGVALSKSSVVADGSDYVSVTLTLKDSDNFPIADVVPQISATDTGATNIYGACTLTNASGVSTCSLRSTRAESKQVWVSYPAGIEALTQNVTFIPGPTDANQSTLVANPTFAPADGVTPVTVTAVVKDAFGNLIAVSTVSIASDIGLGSGSIAPPSVLSAGDGSAVFTVTSTVVGVATITATVGAVPLTTQPTIDFQTSSSATVSISSPVNGSYVTVASNSASFPVSGACNDNGAPIQVQVDTVNAGPATCTAGAWSATINTTSLSEGSHALVALSSGPMGNATSATVNVTKDTLAPALAVGTPSAAALTLTQTAYFDLTYSGESSISLSAGQVNQTPTGSVACSAPSVSTISTSVRRVTIANCTGNGTVSISIAMNSATDLAGNPTPAMGPSSPITVDNLSPLVAITTPASNSYIHVANNSSVFPVSGNCDDSTAGVQVKVDGVNAAGLGTASCNGATWSTTIDTQSLAQGNHTLTAMITDPLLNSTTSTGIPVIKSTLADPAISSATASTSVTAVAVGVTLTVTLRDSNSNLIAGRNVTLTSSRGGLDTITPPSGVSDGSGVVIFNISSTVTGSPTFTATCTTDSVNLSTMPQITFQPGPYSLANSVVGVQSATVVISQMSSVSLTARDAYGNLLTSGGLSVAFSYAGGTGSIGSTTDLGNGTYSAPFTAGGVPGPAYSVGAQINGNGVTSTLPSITVWNPGLNIVVPIELVDFPVSSQTASMTFARTRVPFNSADYDGTVTYTAEIIARNSDPVARSVSLVNSANTPVITIMVPGSTGTYSRFQSAPFTLSGISDYRVQLEGTTATNALNVSTARILVKQVGATNTKIYIPLTGKGGSYSNLDGTLAAGVDSTTSTTWIQGSPDHYSIFKKPSPGSYQTLAPGNSWTFEAVISKDSGGGGMANVQLWDVEANCSPTGALSISGTIPTPLGTSFPDANACFLSGDKMQVRIMNSGGGAAAVLYRAGLWVSLTNLSQVEIRHRIAASMPGTTIDNPQRVLINLSDYSNPNVLFESIASMTGTGSIISSVCTAGANDSGATCSAIGGSALSFDSISNSSTTVQLSGAISIPSGDRLLHDLSIGSGAPTIRHNASYVLIQSN